MESSSSKLPLADLIIFFNKWVNFKFKFLFLPIFKSDPSQVLRFNVHFLHILSKHSGHNIEHNKSNKNKLRTFPVDFELRQRAT